MLSFLGIRALLLVLFKVLCSVRDIFKRDTGGKYFKSNKIIEDGSTVRNTLSIFRNISRMTNNTSVPILLASLFPNCVTALTGGGEGGNTPKVNRPGEGDTDNGAVIYIIAVLVFYSTGVVVMIIQYLKTEKKELEEEVNLEKFFKEMPDGRVEREHHVNQVAIRAFHTLTSISYEDSEDDTSPRTVLVTDL